MNNLVAQELKPAPTAPVDKPDTFTVDKPDTSTVDKPDTSTVDKPDTATMPETAGYVNDDGQRWW